MTRITEFAKMKQATCFSWVKGLQQDMKNINLKVDQVDKSLQSQLRRRRKKRKPGIHNWFRRISSFFNSSDVVDQFSDKFLLTNPHKTKTERKSKGSRRKRKRDSRAEEKLLQSNILSGEIVSPENAKIVKPQSDSW